MTWLSESLETTKPASSLLQAWLEKPGTGPCLRQYPWQHYFHLVTARMKVCPTWGAWKWSLMKALTDDVQSFWGACDSAEDGPKASPYTPPPPLHPTSVCPQLLGEPQCTYGGIPDTTLKQQGTKQQQPDSWSCLVKGQAGQRSSSRLLIPPALWDCRARLYSQCKAKHMQRACRINQAQSVHRLSAQAWQGWVLCKR